MASFPAPALHHVDVGSPDPSAQVPELRRSGEVVGNLFSARTDCWVLSAALATGGREGAPEQKRGLCSAPWELCPL